MQKDTQRAAYLFQRYFNGGSTSIEQDELIDWILLKENSPLVEELLHKAWEASHGRKEIFSKEESKKILQRILQERVEKNNPQKRRIVLKRAIAAAAIALLLISSGYFLLNKPAAKLAKQQTATLKNDVLPGKNKAVLTLANGSTIRLNNTKTGTIAQQGSTKIMKVKNGQLTYQMDIVKNSSRKDIKYNILHTPRGGQYQLTLPDGSKVWLNAASTLRYPIAFNGKDRMVQLSGEAYFEIAQNENQPFKVISNEMTVKVLGTHFNMNTYANNPIVKTTLLDGAVRVDHEEESILLKPGQKVSLTKNIGRLEVAKADVKETVAWKNGLFYFKGDDMAYIMRRISRWYDVKVAYRNGIPPGHYTGIINRNTNLSEVLKVLELSGVHFEIKGRNIIVG